MLNDAVCFKAVYIVCGYTDLRSGIDSLAAVLEAQTGSNPYVPDTLYLFCGRRADRIKGLVWEKDGWLMLYKRLAGSRFQWPRSADEVRELTQQQFRWLMEAPKFRQNCKAARIHGMILCRTENFTALPWQGARQAAHCFRMPVTGRIHDRMASGSDEGF